MLSSTPTITFLISTVTVIVPGGPPSNLSVWRMRWFGTSSRYSPPNEWLEPVERLVNDIL
jgi:hypothetical protein